MNNWETDNDAHLLELLVGDCYGKNPTEVLEAIRNGKLEMSKYIIAELGLNEKSVVLEIGSGAGFTSKHIAPHVNFLHCYDISESFLKVAKHECAGLKNISFSKGSNLVLPYKDNYFDAIFSDAVFIHLNLYDIYWYLSEFKRVIKTRGSVLFNVMSTAKLNLEKLTEMAGYYKDNRNALNMLLCWNSIEAIEQMVGHFNFKIKSIKTHTNIEFVLTKE